MKGYRSGSLDVPTILAKMIRASPALESLRIEFLDESLDPSTHWNPRDLISRLADDHLPYLRVLKILSAWLSPITPSVRLFLHKHPDIHTLCFGPVHMGTPCAISENDMAAAAQSVRHFEGPAFLAKALLNSRVFTQLETLTIVRNVEPPSPMGTAAMQWFHTVPEELSHLRVLRIRLETGVDEVAPLARVAPMLEELEFVGYLGMYSDSDYSEQCLQILNLTPRLRLLTLQRRRSPDGKNSQLTTASVKIFLERAALMCPQLEAIDHLNGSIMSGSWSIRRLAENNAEATYIYRHGNNPFSSLD
ncbi:hypothetical protein FS749_003687, partial [Ceratobasidium sp. UAMH 11750]